MHRGFNLCDICWQYVAGIPLECQGMTVRCAACTKMTLDRAKEVSRGEPKAG